jgi:hypothetical protein
MPLYLTLKTTHIQTHVCGYTKEKKQRVEGLKVLILKCSLSPSFFVFWVVLGFDFSTALCSIDRHSPARTMPPVLFALVIFEIGSRFLPGPRSSYLTLSVIGGMTGASDLAQPLLLKWGLRNIFAWAGLKPVIPPISASKVAKSTGSSSSLYS